MKNSIKYLAKTLLLLLLVSSCQEDDKTIGQIVTPTNLTLTYEIVGKDANNPNGDGSGQVRLKATANNALNYRFVFSDETEASTRTGEYTKMFTNPGTHSYTITVIATGNGGAASSTSVEVTVFSNFKDEELMQMLTGGTTKTWYWSAITPGHLGVGPNDTSGDNHSPIWYAAAPFEKREGVSSCLYQNTLTFTKDGDVLKYLLAGNGDIFFNKSYNKEGGSGDDSQDLCLPYDTSEGSNVAFIPSTSLVADEFKRGTALSFNNNGFMGYYIGATVYDVLSVSDTELRVRAVMGNDPGLAWYMIFTTTPIDEQENPGTEPQYNNLVWSDEFDVDGAPNPANWGYDLGGGGWGNDEKQYYTKNNVIVEDGHLKITLKAENMGGMQYTSSRIKTHNKFDFTYGRVEIRAKLPTGGGTWPALWMLGSNFQTDIWPKCGEIDIMEHVGNQQDVIHGTLHYPGHSGGNATSESVTVPGVSTEFHVYSVIWSPTRIRFFVDGQLYHTFANSESLPFHHDFFLIFNIAMGGNFGGDIAPGFVSSTMEVDYVKVYQE